MDAFLRKVHSQVCVQGCVFFKSQSEVGFQISSADSVYLKFCLFVWIGQSEVKITKLLLSGSCSAHAGHATCCLGPSKKELFVDAMGGISPCSSGASLSCCLHTPALRLLHSFTHLLLCSCGNSPLKCLPGLRRLDRQTSPHTVPSSGSGWGSRSEFCIFSGYLGLHITPPLQWCPAGCDSWSTRVMFCHSHRLSYRIGEVGEHRSPSSC